MHMTGGVIVSRVTFGVSQDCVGVVWVILCIIIE